MSWFLAAIGAAFLGREKIREMRTPVIPASYWRNKELMDADKLNPNISPQQVMQNLQNGKYYLSDEAHKRKQEASKPDYSYREGEDINSWMLRMSRERTERMNKLMGR